MTEVLNFFMERLFQLLISFSQAQVAPIDHPLWSHTDGISSPNPDFHLLWKILVLQEKILPPAQWSCSASSKIKEVPPHPSVSYLYYLFLT